MSDLPLSSFHKTNKISDTVASTSWLIGLVKSDLFLANGLES